MATYANILAWRIPWTEHTGRRQSKGSQKNQTGLKRPHTHTHTHTHPLSACLVAANLPRDQQCVRD